jgi:hypothetical protein
MYAWKIFRAFTEVLSGKAPQLLGFADDNLLGAGRSKPSLVMMCIQCTYIVLSPMKLCNVYSNCKA